MYSETPAAALTREIFRAVHSSWRASLSPPSTPGAANGDADKQSGPSRYLPINSTSKKNDPPATVSEKGRRGTVEAVDGGGRGSSDGTTHTGRARLSRNRPVLSTQTGTATVGANYEASTPEDSLTGTVPPGRTASVMTPVLAAINSTTSHDTLAPAQDKAVRKSTLVTSPAEGLVRGEAGSAGGNMGGRKGGGGGRAIRAEEEEDDNQKSVRNEEVVLSVPRSELLRALRQSGLLRRKAMTSDAVRPILCDRDFTEVSSFCGSPAAKNSTNLVSGGSYSTVDRRQASRFVLRGK